ncbi:MAG: crotonase/enoyl-CoA hydratase family protein [Actinobacteria bacterium]|nr:crotonase/enoyl-CoA hydratase family protein [Actinomycetota bacterium]MBU1944719.1 crotonase/enoyl-CoA hydratase family protein [Actinomycetota bacterium]MBU2688023.1 crotonase/enoyl-CoA hydratase family protein [Actinomycetota bacterium]
MEVLVEKSGPVCTVIINRPEVKNAVDGPTGEALFEAFREFDRDESLRAAVLCGAGGTFCAGADLKAVASGDITRMNRLNEDMGECAPMGPTRLLLSKPVIAAVSGHAVAGGLELAIWCDMRVMEEDAVFGVFERRFGVPLIDGGTQRLPRLIGMSRALDLILTGRPVHAEEALAMGLACRVVPTGKAREEAEAIAGQLAEFPQACMLGDRQALYRGFDLPFDEAMELEFRIGMDTIASGETTSGAGRFAGGEGKHGRF